MLMGRKLQICRAYGAGGATLLWTENFLRRKVESERAMTEDKKKPMDGYDRSNRFQWLKAGFGCFGIHGGLTILLCLFLVAIGVIESLPTIVVPYMIFGWIPLAIGLYPVLKRKLK